MDRLCTIIFTPLSGGNLIAQILSTHFYNNEADVVKAYKQDVPWIQREQLGFKLHPSIHTQPTFADQLENRNFTFEDYCKKRPNLVLISVADEHSRKGIHHRSKVVRTTTSAEDNWSLEFEMNYHTELEHYLTSQNCLLHKLAFRDFFVEADFINTMQRLADKLNLNVSKSTIKNIYNAWRKAHQTQWKYKKQRPPDWFEDKWPNMTNRFGGVDETE